ncbi:hypothetical protein BEN47_10810 [Hymenobacter lapidarius]|uniref:Uncharacterized protein n=1 Tax=Hymenobacter lapidarius TaxID=1908237 RepID=A0A1G1T961_9BACT|nr:hypothetical protein [Hymenobacter lapidarius]OGX87412.1 hypothetical protein BEN47_10810 [Hymenobacter lapidarius]
MEYPLHELTAPAQVQEWFQVIMTDEGNADDFFMKAAKSYLSSIATFYNETPGRPACTTANVAATVLYHDFEQVLSILETEEAARKPVESLLLALNAARTTSRRPFTGGYVGDVIRTVQFALWRIDPGPQSHQLIADFIVGY